MGIEWKLLNINNITKNNEIVEYSIIYSSSSTVDSVSLDLQLHFHQLNLSHLLNMMEV